MQCLYNVVIVVVENKFQFNSHRPTRRRTQTISNDVIATVTVFDTLHYAEVCELTSAGTTTSMCRLQHDQLVGLLINSGRNR